ncbi:MAG: CvpA family protein [Phycisphaeraceae bacterium]|nr:CvpA family protein [Phycisphaeraceae bacterium]
MLANFAVIIFLLLMAYVWAVFQGFFPALVHLVGVIVVGALALAVWEPITVRFLLNPLQDYAWGLGLLLPLLLLTIMLRALTGHFLSRQVSMMNWLDNVGGGLCGLAAGIVTSGLVVIGAGFMPLPIDAFGLQRVTITAEGRVEPAPSRLWIPVDRMAASFFNRLSGGAFSTGTPLRDYLPRLDEQPSMFRLRPTPKSNFLVWPGNIEILDVLEPKTFPQGLDPQVLAALGPEARDGEHRLIIVQARIRRTEEMRDGDEVTRLGPAQVQVIAWRDEDAPQARAYTPLAAIQPTPEAAAEFLALSGMPAAERETRKQKLETAGKETRRFIAFNNPDAMLAEPSREAQVAWVFVIPADREAKFLLVRRLRHALPEATITPPDRIIAALGSPPPPPETPEQAEARKLTEAQFTSALPDPISTQSGGRLEFQGGQLVSADQLVAKPAGPVSALSQVTNFAVPKGKVLLRAKVVFRVAQSWLGRQVQTAALLGPLALTGSRESYEPTGFVLRKANGDQQIRFDPEATIRSASLIPLTQLADQDVLYIYYLVNPGDQLDQIRLGERVLMEVDQTVPAK